MRIVNPKDNSLKAYVEMRNHFCEELNSHPVTVEETEKWIQGNVEVRCLTNDHNNVKMAAVIVYPEKDNEVTIFSYRKGFGDILLKEADKIAEKLGIPFLRAVTEIESAKKAFLRNGYKFDGKQYVKLTHTIKNYGLKADFPLMCVLSMSYVCNAKCPNCPYNNSSIRSLYHDTPFMGRALFESIADECVGKDCVLRLTGGGEPMLHPYIHNMIDYARNVGAKTSLITNGSHSAAQADVVEFSVDAGNEEEYRMVRGLNWFKLLENVEKCTSKKIVSIIEQNDVDVEAAVEFWTPRVDKVQVRKFLTWGLVEDDSADPRPYLHDAPCPWPFERINIDSRGDVTYCGEDIAFDHRFANVNQSSIQEIWMGKEMRGLRNAHLEKTPPKMCLQCPDWKYRSWQHNYWKLMK